VFGHRGVGACGSTCVDVWVCWSECVLLLCVWEFGVWGVWVSEYWCVCVCVCGCVGVLGCDGMDVYVCVLGFVCVCVWGVCFCPCVMWCGTVAV
jgi:hypothetical protein